MFDLIKQVRKKTAFVTAGTLAVSILFSGCAHKEVSIMDTQISQDDGNAAFSAEKTAGLDYLSKDICVISDESSIPSDSAITAKAALLIDDTKQKALFGKAVFKKCYPASVTKIVTAWIALKEANMDDVVTISSNAANIEEPGAKLCGFKEGDQVTMKDLMYCLLVYSGNDAAVAIAEHVSSSTDAFVEEMNAQMKKIGASGTHFTNPNGLHDENHYTNAYDLYLVFHQLLKYDFFQKIIQTSEYTAQWKGADGQNHTLKITNTDSYLSGTTSAPKNFTVIGGKTGTTEAAGSCLILFGQNKKKHNDIAVILGADSSYAMYQQMNTILGYK